MTSPTTSPDRLTSPPGGSPAVRRAEVSQSVWWGRALVASAVLAPVLFVIGQALLPVLSEDLERGFAGIGQHRDRMAAAQLLTACGAFLFIPAAAAILRLVPVKAQGRTALLVGTWIFAVATFFNAVSQVVETYLYLAATAPGVSRTVGLAVVKHLGEGAVGLPVSFWSIPLFELGMLTIGVALLVSRRVPAWVPVLFVVGSVLGGVTAGRGPIVALTMAPLAVAFIVLGLLSARQPQPPMMNGAAHVATGA